MKRLLVLDVHNLAYRNAYALGGLAHEGVATEVVFGVLRDIATLVERYYPCSFAFAFDGPHSFRKELFPEYKGNRKPTTPAEEEGRKRVIEQIDRLGATILPAIGFTNLFKRRGYEADDIMAMVAAAAPDGFDVMLVSTDQDLYQLLDLRTVVLSPRSWGVYNLLNLWADWGVKPGQWATAKAIAGDPGDNVPGVKGVGMATACRALAGTLGLGTKAKGAIEVFMGTATFARNLRLVSLPWGAIDGATVPTPVLRDDQINKDRWDGACRAVGCKSLIGAVTIRGPLGTGFFGHG